MYPADYVPYQNIGECFRTYRDRVEGAKSAAIENWHQTLDRMIYAFEMIASNDPMWEYDEERKIAVEEGLELFGRYFRSLWIRDR